MGLNCSQRGARPRLTLSTAITPGRVGGRYPSAVPHALCRGWSTDKQQQQHPQHTSPCRLGPSLRQPRPVQGSHARLITDCIAVGMTPTRLVEV